MSRVCLQFVIVVFPYQLTIFESRNWQITFGFLLRNLKKGLLHVPIPCAGPEVAGGDMVNHKFYRTPKHQ